MEPYIVAFIYRLSAPFAAGFEMGVVPTVNLTRLIMLSPTNSRSQIFLGSISNSSCARLESNPAINSDPPSLNLPVENSSRLILRETTIAVTTNLDVPGNLSVTRDIAAPKSSGQSNR